MTKVVALAMVLQMKNATGVTLILMTTLAGSSITLLVLMNALMVSMATSSH